MIIILVSGLFVEHGARFSGLSDAQDLWLRIRARGAVRAVMVRELGPVVSALLFASRAGSAMTAEIGLMKTTEQLSAMEMTGSRPDCEGGWRRASGTGVLSMPLLARFFSAMGVYGGYLIA